MYYKSTLLFHLQQYRMLINPPPQIMSPTVLPLMKVTLQCHLKGSNYQDKVYVLQGSICQIVHYLWSKRHFIDHLCESSFLTTENITISQMECE